MSKLDPQNAMKIHYRIEFQQEPGKLRDVWVQYLEDENYLITEDDGFLINVKARCRIEAINEAYTAAYVGVSKIYSVDAYGSGYLVWHKGNPEVKESTWWSNTVNEWWRITKNEDNPALNASTWGENTVNEANLVETKKLEARAFRIFNEDGESSDYLIVDDPLAEGAVHVLYYSCTDFAGQNTNDKAQLAKQIDLCYKRIEEIVKDEDGTPRFVKIARRKLVWVDDD